MLTSLRRFCLLALFAGLSIPASADLVTQLLPDPINGPGSEVFSTANAINSASWVVGHTTLLIDGEFFNDFGTLWKPTGGPTAPAFGVAEGFDDPYAVEGFYDVDIHDNGDVLLRAVTVEGAFSGTCADPPCIDGDIFSVAHFGGGPVLSNKDNIHVQAGVTVEWLSDLSLWGAIDPHTTNKSGQRIENFGPCTVDDVVSGCGARLITPSVPEPASVILLGSLLVPLALKAAQRQGVIASAKSAMNRCLATSGHSD